MKTALANIFVLGVCMSSLNAQPCPDTPFMPTPLGTEGWLVPYGLSITNANSTITNEKSSADAQWDKLRVMPLQDPITFLQWEQIDGVWVQSEATIQEPVIVVTWSFASIPNTSITEGLGENLSNRRIMQRYVTSQDPSNSNATLWFTKHGNTADYLEGINVDRACLNLSLDDFACDQAIAWGVPTVGLPYGFEQTSPHQPYENVLGAWWGEYMLIGIADRRAFVRPSYNPAVAEETPAWKTGDGVPLWSDDRQQYWYAQSGTLEYDAQQAALNDPSDDPAFQFKAYNLNQTMTTDFKAWLKAWQEGSWMPADQPGNCYVNGFPYTSIGLTANWQYATIESDLDDRFLCLSEFILKADAPLWWFGRRSGAQYLGQPDPDLGQVSWCDSCWGDLDMSGAVDTGDLMMVLDAWGLRNPCMDLAADYGDPACSSPEQMQPVDIMDLLWILQKWGPCEGWPESMQSLRPDDCQ